MIEDAVEDLIGLAMQALNLSDPEGDEQNGSNYGKNFTSNFKLLKIMVLHLDFRYIVFKSNSCHLKTKDIIKEVLF